MFDFMLDSVADKLTIGGQVTLLGMGTVFAVLALLWGLVEVLHLLLGHPAEKKVSKPVKAEAPAPAPVVEPAAPVQSEPVPVANDLDIIAVITAAVAAASGASPSSFRVVSFKRANNKFSYRK